MESQYSDLCKASLEGENPKILPGSLMGCENWAMLLIREIAAPKVFKEQKQNLPSHIKGVQEGADGIERHLSIGLRQSGRSYIEITEGKLSPSSPQEVAITGVRLIFALSALIYPEVVCHGSSTSALQRVQQLLFRRALSFRFLPDKSKLPLIAWRVHSGLHGGEADAAVVLPGRGGMRWGARARRWHATPGAGDHGAALGREEGGGREGAGWEWERVVKGRRELVLVI